MVKILIFYGGMFVALLGTLLLWLVWHPKLKVEAITDTANGCFRLRIRAARTSKPIRLTDITMLQEDVSTLGVSAPEGFKVDTRWTESVWQDDERRSIKTWTGERDIPPHETVELLVPASRPSSAGGVLQVSYEYIGIGIMHTWVYVPFNGGTE